MPPSHRHRASSRTALRTWMTLAAAAGVMALITMTLIGFFSYKRYLTRTGK